MRECGNALLECGNIIFPLLPSLDLELLDLDVCSLAAQSNDLPVTLAETGERGSEKV
jgi:hypothetical protein